MLCIWSKLMKIWELRFRKDLCKSVGPGICRISLVHHSQEGNLRQIEGRLTGSASEGIAKQCQTPPAVGTFKFEDMPMKIERRIGSAKLI
jgi:hypothetical protein